MIRSGYASATAQGWSAGGRNPGLQTGANHRGAQVRFACLWCVSWAVGSIERPVPHETTISEPASAFRAIFAFHEALSCEHDFGYVDYEVNDANKRANAPVGLSSR